MVPLEVFPPTVRTVAHLTPHAWGNDAFSSCSSTAAASGTCSATSASCSRFAAVLLALGTWRLRRALIA